MLSKLVPPRSSHVLGWNQQLALDSVACVAMGSVWYIIVGGCDGAGRGKACAQGYGKVITQSRVSCQHGAWVLSGWTLGVSVYVWVWLA